MLFATEMWERFSYFGMASLLVLYMVKYLLLPGQVEAVLGYRAVKAALESLFGPLDVQPLASQIFGFYTGLAYFTPILGGVLADRVLGQRNTAIIGALLMAVGHFLMAFESLLFVALGFLILGIGAFKPNVSTQVGSLYGPDDPRAAARLFDLLCRHQYRRIPGAARCRHARRRSRLALRLCSRRRRHAGRHRDLCRRNALAAAGRVASRARRACADATVQRGRMARHRRPPLRVRAGGVLLGDLRPAGQHAVAVVRRLHRALGQSRLLDRARFRPPGFSRSIR